SSWTKLNLPSSTAPVVTGSDTGGPFARGRYSNVRIGTNEVPFVVAIGSVVYAIQQTGSLRQLFPPLLTPMVGNPVTLAGSNRQGNRFLVAASNGGVFNVDLNGAQTAVMPASNITGYLEGWITPDGAAYIEQTLAPGNVVLWYAKNGTASRVAASWDGDPNVQPAINSSWVFFAVPTADYSGAWIIKRGGSRPTTLLLHTFSAGLVQQWQDVSAPEVEALHPAASGTKVLIQVHRPRQSVDQMLFKDPALAVWHAGDPAPKSYDELFLSETQTKGFVH